jgi:hypothetical protein
MHHAWTESLDDGEPLTSAAPVSHRGALPPCVSVARGGHVGGRVAWAGAAAAAACEPPNWPTRGARRTIISPSPSTRQGVHSEIARV